jgi:hypothetical protein
MKLAATEAMNRLATHLHGVLGTVHPTRAVDVVPVVYAISTQSLRDSRSQQDTSFGIDEQAADEDADTFVGVPIDLVKPKAHTRLQRIVNLEADPRATLLIDHWDQDDWTQLWWVRTELRWISDPSEAGLSDILEDLRITLVSRYPQYRNSPFADILVFRIAAVSGWSASPTT